MMPSTFIRIPSAMKAPEPDHQIFDHIADLRVTGLEVDGYVLVGDHRQPVAVGEGADAESVLGAQRVEFGLVAKQPLLALLDLARRLGSVRGLGRENHIRRPPLDRIQNDRVAFRRGMNRFHVRSP